ncbi:carnitine O-acetyltransferase CAT2 [Sugiyamaella lignohabitans]|uniref:Carnitine O-acetyltransferase, mitochondrial n=1 Tax=Sugiyamaella lignohabitans TaxID=796027 RepID=A0A167DDE3_9ASCO|nr:carnitine O-acetyltransferase CAT2 [Sugiyamaella lignohabitans]ANB12786.1 carnitine O-acetyltransferase CAT2 [Sugiyamaella lignohabitans]
MLSTRLVPLRRSVNMVSRSAVSSSMTLGLRANSTGAKLPPPYVEDISKGATFRFQDSLPKLPVPTLEETAVKYLRSVKAIASPEQYSNTEKAVKEFLKPGSQGPELQKKLLARANDPNVKNWLSEWWNEGAYMAYRDPVVPYVSYFYSYKDDKLRTNPATRAAAIATGALSFKNQYDTKTLEPEYMKKLPICMDLYQYMFHACRIPVEGADQMAQYPTDNNTHIIVIRKNRFFKVPYIVNGKQLSTSELELEFLKIYDLTKSLGHGPAIGALTSENRDKWTKFRQQLLAADPKNKESLKQIEAAAFVICLDEGAPVTREERAHQYWHGDGQNRFYDKPLQFIVADNGAAGFMGEHSMMDGTQTHRINDYLNDVIVNNKIEFGTSTENSSSHKPEEITFGLNSEVEKAISESIQDFKEVIGKHELSVFAYKGYGKGLIKKFKTSPDAYVQMLIQLAYYKYQGECRPTYESAATRRFQLGRTETCRSVSLESVNFVNTFTSPTASNADKIAAARKAFDSHVKYISDASAGKGVDRHLFGLKKLLSPNEDVPAIFSDPMYTYSSSWFLSTSQLSSEYFNGYGWSQVIDQGFGLAYMINENSIQVNIVSKGLGSEKMRHYLEEAADELGELFSSELNQSKL